MLTLPRTPGSFISSIGNLTKTFVRIREITNEVVCLQIGAKHFEYRSIIKVSTVNFSLMAEDEQDTLIEGFKSFLNGLAFPIQILIRNLPYNLNNYLHTMESVQGDLAEIAHDHALFVRQLASKRALVKREFYIIVPADREGSARVSKETFINAHTQLRLRFEELRRQLERLGLTAHRLTDEEIITLYQQYFTPADASLFPISQNMREGVGRLMRTDADDLLPAPPSFGYIQEMDDNSTQAVQARQWQKKPRKSTRIVPEFTELPDLLAPGSLQVFPEYIRIDGEMGQEFLKTTSIANYPRSAYPGWFDALVQVDEPHVDFTIHIAPLDSTQVNSRLGRKALEFRGAAIVAERHGKKPDPTTAIALNDVEKLRENLARGDERVFAISVFIQVRAHTRRELDERHNRIMTTIRSLDFRALPMHWQHHMGFLSCLPEADNVLGKGRLFGTSAASTFYPFTGGDSSMDSGVLFGVLPNGGLVIVNPFKSDELENANMVVFAKSGAGKSFFLKTVSSRLLPLCNVYIIDPEAEYNTMCSRVHGQYIRLSSDSLQFNPLELYGQQSGTSGKFRVHEPQNDENNFFREKLLNIITLCEILLSDNGSLPQREKAFLYRCLVKTYELRGITVNPITHTRPVPNMQEFYQVMTSQSRGDHRYSIGEDIYGLSERLERYLHLFPEKTSITLENRFIDFNIRELNDSLKPIGLFLITEFLWTKMRQARQSQMAQPNTIILIDEAWLLMQFKQGAKFLAEFARRIRKYGGGLWCTTQNSDDFLGSEEGRTILAMATMKFLMKQDATTIESVIRTFRLSAGQKNFLLGARRGEGLFSTKSWTAMEVVASPKEAEMANTTPKQFVAEAMGMQPETAFLDEVWYETDAEDLEEETIR